MSQLAAALGLLMLFVSATTVFALVYKVIPLVQVRWRDVWTGAVLTAMLFTFGKFLIGLYIGRSGVISGFGAAGSLVVVLLRVCCSTQIFFDGR